MLLKPQYNPKPPLLFSDLEVGDLFFHKTELFMVTNPVENNSTILANAVCIAGPHTGTTYYFEDTVEVGLLTKEYAIVYDPVKDVEFYR